MKTIFRISILLAFSLSCTSNHNYFENFRFGQNAVLEISITQVSSPVDFQVYSRHLFPMNEFKHLAVINQDTNFTVALPSNIYDLAFIKIGDDSYMNIYTIPKDTLKISLNLDSELKREERISFEGSASCIYQYYEAKRKHWIKTKGYDYYYDSTVSLQSFTDKMDRNRDNDLRFLSEYESANELPDWFLDFEKNSIIYETAGSKIGIINYHQLFYDSEFEAPEDYFAFAEKMKINNPEAYLSSAYYGFLSLNYGRNFEVGETGFQGNFQRCIQTLALIESEDFALDPRIMDVLLGMRISILYRDKYLIPNNFRQADSILEISEPYFRNEANFRIIREYRNSKYSELGNMHILNPGDDAPDFYLSDENGQYVRLSDFSGKIVYINFWGTYCSPCIASIPEKNLLVEEFSNQSFELVNICLDAKPELWSSLIEEQDFAGTHLICRGNWSSILRDRYLIHSVPHYALIDKEGKLISNKCEKPDEISEQIRSLLN